MSQLKTWVPIDSHIPSVLTNCPYLTANLVESSEPIIDLSCRSYLWEIREGVISASVFLKVCSISAWIAYRLGVCGVWARSDLFFCYLWWIFKLRNKCLWVCPDDLSPTGPASGPGPSLIGIRQILVTWRQPEGGEEGPNSRWYRFIQGRETLYSWQK